MGNRMDPDNPVVKLCAQGMQAEAQGKMDEALSLFQQAWQASQDDYEACIAAHYVARHAETPEAALHWNLVSLERADRAGGEAVAGFYPSLYLNLGWASETLGDRQAATRYYALAAESLAALPPGPYQEMVAQGIANAQARLGL